MRKLFSAVVLSLTASALADSDQKAWAEPAIEVATLDASVGWPTVTQSARPWTRWWWLGSAVDKADITRLLEAYSAAGLGGVEITSIYGVRGAENRELPFLSEIWIDAVRHAVRDAKRLRMGVDLPTGSGWRTGGPSVTDDDANREVVIEHEPLESGSAFRWTFDQAPPQALVAYGPDGQIEDLGERLRDRAASGDLGHLEWQVPDGEWTLYSVTERWSRDNVKRPAPGGEGKNINPLLRRSLVHFLDWFGERLDGVPADGIRAQFHDSYEYEGNWCEDFLAQFERRRGYKLEHHLPALSDTGRASSGSPRRGFVLEGRPSAANRTGRASGTQAEASGTQAPSAEAIARVKHDYRETVAELVLEEFIETWTDWSHEHGMLSRNQSHGSPANWLDLYSACDIPEIESFGRLEGGDTKRYVFMFASSAAHVMGKPLVSAETATWLNEHFTTKLGEVKEICDRLFLAGVNHVFYHGTCYSPEDAAWPGWLFYASTQLNPQNPIWRDFPALNRYVTRCQSVLQSTRPDNDVLLYWPIHDYWQQPRGLRADIRVHNSGEWFGGGLADAFKQLDEQGYTFDYVSDRQLTECRFEDGQICTPGARYALILVPNAHWMPQKTLRSLVDLAEEGATIAFLYGLPVGPPGVVSDEDRAAWDELLARFEPSEELSPEADDEPAESNNEDCRCADQPYVEQVGRGRVLVFSRVVPPLEEYGVRRETIGPVEQRLRFHRRSWSGGHVYFVKNESAEPFDDWVSLSVDWAGAIIMDPLDDRVGLANEKTVEAGGARQLRLQLAPGQTAFIKTYREPVHAGDWAYREPVGKPTPLDGDWSVEFVAGGPELPAPLTTSRLASWTELAGAEGQRFAGTARYTTTFTPDAAAERYLLDLGHVAASAKVELNGKPVATLVGSPYQVEIRPLRSQANRLVVEVTNVAANRIRDLDRRGVRWRIFKDINFVNIDYRPFDASEWPIRGAGLLGPVTITPLAD